MVLARFVDWVAAVAAPEVLEVSGAIGVVEAAEAVEQGNCAAGLEVGWKKLPPSFPLLWEAQASSPRAFFRGLVPARASFRGLSQVRASFPLAWELVSTRAYSHRNGVYPYISMAQLSSTHIFHTPRNLAKSTLSTYIQPPRSPCMRMGSLQEHLRTRYLGGGRCTNPRQSISTAFHPKLFCIPCIHAHPCNLACPRRRDACSCILPW